MSGREQLQRVREQNGTASHSPLADQTASEETSITRKVEAAFKKDMNTNCQKETVLQTKLTSNYE